MQKSKKRASSRSQIAIAGIEDGILQLNGHKYRLIMRVSSVNFELRSQEEQDAIIDTYESFLNSIGTELQILIRTREVDMDKYLADLKLRLSVEKENVYQDQLIAYDEFIRTLIQSNKILTRHFYVIIPYDAVTKSDRVIVKEQLHLKADIVSKGLARLGIRAEKLSSLETLDLFHSFYSPAQAKIQPLTSQALKIIHTSLTQGGYIYG